MKKLMVALLLLVAVSSVANAQAPFIGMYADVDAVVCHNELAVYANTSVYFFATLPPEILAISACEFRVDNLLTAADAIVTPAWNTPLVIGDAGYGIALAFNPILGGPLAFLGQIDFFGLADIGPDYVMSIQPSNDSGNLVVVDDLFNTIDAEGGIFTFNCASGDCECTEGVATEDATMSSIKALY
jgi:hypothetical protein